MNQVLPTALSSLVQNLPKNSWKVSRVLHVEKMLHRGWILPYFHLNSSLKSSCSKLHYKRKQRCNKQWINDCTQKAYLEIKLELIHCTLLGLICVCSSFTEMALLFLYLCFCIHRSFRLGSPNQSYLSRNSNSQLKFFSLHMWILLTKEKFSA